MYASSLSLVEICNGAGAALLLLLASEYIFLLLFTVKTSHPLASASSVHSQEILISSKMHDCVQGLHLSYSCLNRPAIKILHHVLNQVLRKTQPCSADVSLSKRTKRFTFTSIVFLNTTQNDPQVLDIV